MNCCIAGADSVGRDSLVKDGRVGISANFELAARSRTADQDVYGTTVVSRASFGSGFLVFRVSGSELLGHVHKHNKHTGRATTWTETRWRSVLLGELDPRGSGLLFFMFIL